MVAETFGLQSIAVGVSEENNNSFIGCPSYSSRTYSAKGIDQTVDTPHAQLSMVKHSAMSSFEGSSKLPTQTEEAIFGGSNL